MKRTVKKFSRELLGVCIVLGAQIPSLGANATTILPSVNNGSTVWTGSNPLALDAAQIGAIVGAPGLGLLYDVQFGKARVASNGVANSQVVVTAVQNGTAGQDITVEIVNPGAANQPLGVSVVGHTIKVSLATNGSGTVTSTSAQVAAAINAHPSAAALVTVSAGGTGAGVVQTLSPTLLAPAIVETGPFAGSYQTTFANSASSPQDATVAYSSSAAIAAGSLFLYVRDSGNAPAFYIYDLLAPAFRWNGLENLMLQGFWPGAGAIEQVSIVGGAARPTTSVPEGSPLALLSLGLGVLAWIRRRARLRA